VNERVLYRVDPRFVHATLMNAWVPATGATRIIVADREAVRSMRLRTILEMSTMDLVSLEFVDEEELPGVFQRTPSAPTIVLFGSIEGAERAVNNGLSMKELNIGHLPEAPDRRPVLTAIHLGPRDLDLVKGLEARGIQVYLQQLPRDPRTSPFADGVAAIARSVQTVEPTQRPSLRPRSLSSPSHVPAKMTRIEEKLRVVNERGLHLRAAHQLAHLAGTLKEEVQVGRLGEFVNAKSLLGLTTLGAGCGTRVDVVITGPNPDAAARAIRDLFARGFDEGVAFIEGQTPDPEAEA
jgi:phosphotransferase system HPr (HPr) family protein